MAAAAVVIAGGGLGAVRTAQALRDLDHPGRITLLSAEPDLPYDRPPLSKNFLLGLTDERSIRLLDEDRLATLEIELRLGEAAAGLDLETRRLRLAGGAEVGFDRLVVATGARPIQLPIFAERRGVFHLRDLDQARGLREALASRPPVGIVGGGFIGLEVAAVATELGCRVTVIEAAEQPLAAVLGPELGSWVREWHQRRGVEFRCGSPVAEVVGEDRVERLLLADGGEVDAAVAVVGIGVRPNVEWLEDSGLELHQGLVCDADGRSSDPQVFGVGDAIFRHRNGVCSPAGHWTAASDGARAAAAAIAGAPPPPPIEEGYFWSDQFGKRLQFTGSVPADPQLEIVAGSRDEDAFVVAIRDRDGSEAALFSLDMPREFVRASLAFRRAKTTA